jgi:general secretion pathway protein G
MNNRILNRHSSSARSGFTLLEIMLVVAIIALLAGVAVSKMGDLYLEAQRITTKTNINSFGSFLLTYRAKGGNFPSSEQGLQALTTRPTAEPQPMSWMVLMKDIPKDPWGREYFYECPGKHNQDGYDIYSAGPNRVPGDADDLGNWQSPS